MWNFIKLLGISGLHVTRYWREEKQMVFALTVRRKTAHCPQCNKRSCHMHGHGRKRRVLHGTILEKQCILEWIPRRFSCLSCVSVFTEHVPFVQSHQRATLKHKREVIGNLADRSFSSGTKRYGISYATQRKWLIELVSGTVYNFDEEQKRRVPFVLGIDEVSFAGRDMVTTIGNITTHRLKGILRSRRKDELRKVLRSIPKEVRPLIEEVVIDMCMLYLRTVQEVLPRAQIVVDHFHIIQDANRRIDSERLLLQDIYKKSIPRYLFTKNKEDLTPSQIFYMGEIIKRYPELKMFWETKEQLRSMYKSATKDEATERLRLIIATLTSTDDGELISWGRTLSRWRQYILNYWNHKSTNGFMEGIHNKMKLIKRISFGFKNKEVFIHKVMLSVLVGILLGHSNV